jgi:hypothetical protein
VVRLDGALPHDRTPEDDPVQNPLSSGIPNYNFYSLEVVQRIGYDSFTPDNGVLLAKNKDKESTNGGPNGFNTFNWVIDAVPEDKKIIDFVRPDGTNVYRTVADYRQLNDALFHAGLHSGSQYEWVDEPNRLHFYIINKEMSKEGVLFYDVAVRHLDGKGVDRQIKWTSKTKGIKGITTEPKQVRLEISNESVQQDVLRVQYSIEGSGWNAELPNALVGLQATSNGSMDLYVYHQGPSSAKNAILTVTVHSESDPTKRVTQKIKLSR